MLQELTALKPAAGFDRVYYPGQIEGLQRAHRRATGIPIEAGLADELAKLGQRYHVQLPTA